MYSITLSPHFVNFIQGKIHHLRILIFMLNFLLSIIMTESLCPVDYYTSTISVENFQEATIFVSMCWLVERDFNTFIH